jgi:DNA-binding NarL/FixJ family response regulator
MKECDVVAMADNALSFSDAVESLSPELVAIDMSVRVPYQGNLVRQVWSRYPNLTIIVLAED